MNAEDILARKRELLDARRAAREAGGDPLRLALIEEELTDLNARLRALRGGCRSQGTTNSGFSMDRDAYLKWKSDERADEMREAHQTYRDALRACGGVLSGRQKELFDLWQSGSGVTEIADTLGIDKSTASRTLARGKARLRQEAERMALALRLRDARVFDLADPDVARIILACLTARQAVCVYLYYGEWLSLRECGELLGVDHTAVLRSVARGLRAIRDTLRCEAFTLDNADALSEIAYRLYLESGAPDPSMFEAEPAPSGAWARRKARQNTRRKPRSAPEAAACVVRTSDGMVSRQGEAHDSLSRPMSKLREKGPLARWLTSLFAKLTRRKKPNRYTPTHTRRDGA